MFQCFIIQNQEDKNNTEHTSTFKAQPFNRQACEVTE